MVRCGRRAMLARRRRRGTRRRTGGRPAAFCSLAEEHVAVVDPAVAVQDAHRAQAALALAAVAHHLDAGVLEGVEQGRPCDRR